MDYDEIEALRRNSAAWRLLRADNAPLVLSFLGRVFVEELCSSRGGSRRRPVGGAGANARPVSKLAC